MERNERKHELKIVVIFTAILFVVGLAMLFLTIFVFGKGLTWDEVGAVVMSNDKEAKKVILSYSYKDVDYLFNTVKNFSTNAQVGDIIKIRVNPKNPSDFVILDQMGLLVTMFVLSGIMIAASIGMPTYYFIKSRKQKEQIA